MSGNAYVTGSTQSLSLVDVGLRKFVHRKQRDLEIGLSAWLATVQLLATVRGEIRMPSFRDSSFAFLQGASYSTTATITGTSDPTLYQSEHYNAGNLTYQTSVPNGTYTVKLRLAELYWTSPGQRVFNVQLNGTQVGTNLDVFAEAGGINKAYMMQSTENRCRFDLVRAGQLMSVWTCRNFGFGRRRCCFQ